MTSATESQAVPTDMTADMSTGMTPEQLDPVQAERIRRAPLPTPQTLFARKCVPIQVGKFAVTNLRIMDIVLRERLGH